MEAQQANAGISQLSSMNAFYGIPNTSQETTAAIESGAQAPEVFKPGTRDPIVPEQNQQTEPSGAQETQANPVEPFFAQAREQLEISNQAVAMQQQTQQQTQQQNVANSDTQAATYIAADAITDPQTSNNNAAQLQTREGMDSSGQLAVEQRMTTSQTQTATVPEPRATTSLNSGPVTPSQTTTTESAQQPAANSPAASYDQFSGSGPEASSASQAGNLFSARG